VHFGAVTSLTIPTGAESRAFLLPFDLFRHSTFARPLCPFLSQYIVRQWELILRKTSVHPTAGTKTPDVVSFLRGPAWPVEAMKNHRRKRAFRQGLRCNMHRIKQLLISIYCSHLMYVTYRFLHYPQLTTEFWLTFCGTKRHYLTYSQLIADCTAATCAFHPHGN
jgi:hypothetical protein